MNCLNLTTDVLIVPDGQFRTIREPEAVILDSDPYERVYNDLPDKHLVLRKVPICEYCGAIIVCLVVGLVGWVGSIPHFGDGADPFLVWFHL